MKLWINMESDKVLGGAVSRGNVRHDDEQMDKDGLTNKVICRGRFASKP